MSARPFLRVSALHDASRSPSVLGEFVLGTRRIDFRRMDLNNSHRLPYPPGPKRLPLIGNLLDLPQRDESLTYNQIISTELFDKRSANYSDRADLTMINELMGWDCMFGNMRYGEKYKKHRRTFHRQFQASAIQVFSQTQTREAHKLIRLMLHSPHNFVEHLRENAASLIMNVTYGIEICGKDDEYVTIAEMALDGLAKAAAPGAFWVWGFKRKAREWRAAVVQMRDAPFAAVLEHINRGVARPSFVTYQMSGLESHSDVDEQIELIKGCAGMTYAALQTVSALHSFILAMIAYPEVQKKAQKEIDEVVGCGRLPDLDDRDSLPYIDAIVKELFRAALPHTSTHSDEFRGYHIPAGTLVIGNSWTILHDPVRYPEPHKFVPERFIPNTPNQDMSHVLAPLSCSFGYGRRMCPGRPLAETQIWLSVVCILSVFDIQREDLHPVEPKFTSGMICHPEPFRCNILPRGEFAVRLIRQTEDLI
ncbi:cytochrome P450 [Fistulina hepatica ATCC 64428]|uniref:Cytochrome P450 n=1 Tax=Fistulina hepatica ATCC 64428 TaxID=1128425 RepID=A0A0D7AGD1_9AGAR|nr:cytochrome P450 [Fistulina hepatica ATCC 64428]